MTRMGMRVSFWRNRAASDSVASSRGDIARDIPRWNAEALLLHERFEIART
jgi:hypothetical protein